MTAPYIFPTETRHYLAAARSNAGRTQQDVANMLGVEPWRVSAWETGRETPAPQVLISWAATVGLRVRAVVEPAR